MELRSCANTHFIQVIRGGLIIKVRNIDSHGKPALASKTLKDIYEAEDAKRLEKPSPMTCHSMSANLDQEHVKMENPCSPIVDRRTAECIPDDHEGLDSDVDDETTLSQLRKRTLTRKRKIIHIISDENASKACANEKLEEVDSDLSEPLINWKLKNMKGSKSKRKSMSGGAVSCCMIASAVISEENHLSQGSLQADGELPLVCVKIEVPEADEMGNQSRTLSDPSFHAYDESFNSVGEASKEFQEMAENECGEVILTAEKYPHRITNEISYERLEVAEPLYMLVPWDGMSVKLETPEFDCEDPPVLSIEMESETEDIDSPRNSPSLGSSEVYNHAGDSSRNEVISEQSSGSGFQLPTVAIKGTGNHQELSCVIFEDEFRANSQQEQYASLNGPGKKSGFSQASRNNSNFRESTVLETEPLTTCTFDDMTTVVLNDVGNLEDGLSKAADEETSVSSNTDTERQSCLEAQTFDGAGTHATQESRQSPGRLLSMRKAISPSSQEQLRLAMSSLELCDDLDQLKSKGKFFEKKTGKRASSVRSNIQQAKVAANHGGNGKVSQRKVIISSRRVMNKSQNANGNIEGPRFSRALPNLNTGCTSVEGCSESAIAFSQMQLHDIETLAEKLMNELKSMKDIVEQKLLFEAYRSVSLRNDADEVKSAITNACKVEEAAQKWLTMMTRDCHRFCKIMKLTSNSASASKDAVPQRRKKIMFADEVGGKLCHVKVFEHGVMDYIKEEEVSL